MSLNDFLLSEFDAEMKRTRSTLERVPSDKKDFAPHPKSMPLGKLAPHVAQLAGFGEQILTTSAIDLSQRKPGQAPPETAQQLVTTMNEGAAKARAALQKITDQGWNDPWKLTMGDTVLFQGPRFQAYRAMFLNHLIHHRAQLGVYLRLNEIAVPSIYGPSADEPVTTA
jgi:uncharacterized damage-inducible protein DinB